MWRPLFEGHCEFNTDSPAHKVSFKWKFGRCKYTIKPSALFIVASMYRRIANPQHPHYIVYLPIVSYICWCSCRIKCEIILEYLWLNAQPNAAVGMNLEHINQIIKSDYCLCLTWPERFKMGTVGNDCFWSSAWKSTDDENEEHEWKWSQGFKASNADELEQLDMLGLTSHTNTKSYPAQTHCQLCFWCGERPALSTRKNPLKSEHQVRMLWVVSTLNTPCWGISLCLILTHTHTHT